MAGWVVWALLAGMLAVAEVLTLTLVLGMLAGGAAAAALVGALDGPFAAQAGTFVVVSGLLLGGVLPAARRHRHLPGSLRTGSAALVGTRGTALTVVDRAGGQVTLRGEAWTARPYDETLTIPAATDVEVFAIDGATAVVHPVHSPGPGTVPPVTGS